MNRFEFKMRFPFPKIKCICKEVGHNDIVSGRRHQFSVIGALCILSVLFFVYHLKKNVKICSYNDPFSTVDKSFQHTRKSTELPSTSTLADRLNNSISCHLPKLNPFDQTISKYVFQPPPTNCTNQHHPFIFQTDLDASLIRVRKPEALGYTKCCYRSFRHLPGSDYRILVSKNCVPVNKKKTRFKPPTEFIQVECQQNGVSVVVDVLSFVFKKEPVEIRLKRIKKAKKSSRNSYPQVRKVNVVILGIDAVSHMNFMRIMPLSHKYLNQNLSALNLSGYTKVGDNTFPNLVPVTMGMSESEIRKSCWKNQKYFDDCPFIWKDYTSDGYVTAYGEDAVSMGIWNYKKNGFNDTPTDYYYNGFTFHQNKLIGHEYRINTNICAGPRLAFETLLEYTRKMAVRMNKEQRYFQFIWATSLFHDYLNEGMLGDESLLNTLMWFHEEGYLKDTVFILMSDHGIRWGEILNTPNGKLEERMPFLYLIFPKWFSKNYQLAVNNVIHNKERLTTPFDLYETLKDILRLENIKDNAILRRTENLAKPSSSLPRAISLFLPISTTRTCSDAEIPDNFCVCFARSPLDLVNNSFVQEAALQIVSFINRKLQEFPQCQFLTLGTILNAQVLVMDNSSLDHFRHIKDITDPYLKVHPVTLSLGFSVRPSEATFEATIVRSNVTWHISDYIARTNIYKGQSDCVSDYKLKPFCYCFH